MDLEKLKVAILSDNLRITIHADEELEEDNISVIDIKCALKNAEVIEDYPNTKPYSSCLVLCFDNNNNPIHFVWAYDAEIKIAILITAYRPAPNKWVEYRKRI